MRLLRLMTLYMALTLCANAALADLSMIKDMRQGDMKKLNIHSSPKPASSKEYLLANNAGSGRLSDYQGKYVVLNFWATWCAPCRKEMPQLSALQASMGNDRFAVVTLATGRNSPAGIKKFFAQIGVSNLPRHRDPKQAVARDMGVLALPITVILDPKGREIARLTGEADWNSENARAILTALMAQTNG